LGSVVSRITGREERAWSWEGANTVSISRGATKETTKKVRKFCWLGTARRVVGLFAKEPELHLGGTYWRRRAQNPCSPSNWINRESFRSNLSSFNHRGKGGQPARSEGDDERADGNIDFLGSVNFKMRKGAGKRKLKNRSLLGTEIILVAQQKSRKKDS